MMRRKWGRYCLNRGEKKEGEEKRKRKGDSLCKKPAT